jgi:1-acyl-sn-glycerol-3-phosphate acyltransferase
VDRVHHSDPFQRDPALIRKVLPLLRAIDCYFSAEVRGWKNVPQRGPFLVVGNHSGGAQPVDLWPFFVRWVDERGADDPFYTLTYDLDFAAPQRKYLAAGCRGAVCSGRHLR